MKLNREHVMEELVKMESTKMAESGITIDSNIGEWVEHLYGDAVDVIIRLMV